MRRAGPLLLLLSACTAPVQPPGPSCRDAGCQGCCDATDVCQAGTDDQSCGHSGDGCARCGAGNHCAARACVADLPPECGLLTCAGCCDATGACRGGRDPQTCGEDGTACRTCASQELCSAGACIVVHQCDPACGPQCCAGAACAASPCGSDGGTCATCGAGELCSAGSCGPADGTRWRLRIVSAHIAPLKPSGEPWDDKSDPDGKVCANVGDAGQSCTLEVTDSFDPVWNTLYPPTYDAAQLGQVELSAIDVDYPGETVMEEFGTLDLRPRWSGEAQRWVLDGVSVTGLRIDVEPAP